MYVQFVQSPKPLVEKHTIWRKARGGYEIRDLTPAQRLISCHASIPRSRLLRMACVHILCRDRAGGVVGSCYPRQEDDASTEQNTWTAIWTLLTWPPHHVRDSLSVHLDFNAQIVSYTLASLLLKSGQVFGKSEYSCPRGNIKCLSSWDRRASLKGASVSVVCDFCCSQ